MTLDERMDLLAKVDIFQHLKRGDLKTLAKTTKEETYHAGDVLCRQGDRGIAAFIVAQGRIAVEEELAGGRVLEVAALGPGAVVGELSLIDGAERVATIRAKDEVVSLVLTQWDFNAALKKRPAMAADILPVLVRRFRGLAADLRAVKSDRRSDIATP